MKCGGSETIRVDVRERRHRARVAEAQQVEIIRMLTKLREQRNRIDARAVVMNLALKLTAGRGAVIEIPLAAGVAVVTPIRHERHVTEN